MAQQMRATIVAQYPLPGGGKVALSILSDSMTGEQYELLANVIKAVVPLAESLGWTREGQQPAKPERKPRPKSEVVPVPIVAPGYPLTAVPISPSQSRPEDGP